jgi:hypothetical protein
LGSANAHRNLYEEINLINYLRRAARSVTAAVALTAAATTFPAEARDDVSVRTNIQWCLIDGQGRIEGRERMRAALEEPNLDMALFDFTNGFVDCQKRDPTKIRNFFEWDTAERKGPYNYGRSLFGMEPR